MLPDLRPSLDDLRAVVTTKWKKSGYRPLPIRTIENYYVDTALDNDSDTWQIQIGDPDGDYFPLAQRNNEIRVQFFGPGREGVNYILTGIGDDAEWEDGSWTLTGRDYSSLAIDSDVPPQQFRHVRAWAIVDMQSQLLGFKRRSLAHGKMVKKVQFTDGSESYWQFWYRLYRKEQMWIWTEPTGLLVAGTLNYSDHIDYYFGDPVVDDPISVKQQHVPVEALKIYKTTQGRVAEVHVFGHKGDNGFRAIVKDPTMSDWIKKPKKVLLDTESHTTAGAKKLGLEEIFEGKVGSVEYTITIPDPGFPIRQNKIARLNFPEIGLRGQFFVVGCRMQGGPDGFVQEVRLREKQYAITRRVPTDPKKSTSDVPGASSSTYFGSGLEAAISGLPNGWGNYFIKAAKQFHGPWDFQLFLATLLGICNQETGFQNKRQNGGPGGDGVIWYAYQGAAGFGTQAQVGDVHVVGRGETRKEYETKFANQLGDGYVTFEMGVGPMQLTSRGLKYEADDRLKQNNRDEFAGGRWHPEHNIWIAAQSLRKHLQTVVGDSGRDIDLWMGVMAYNRGDQGALDYFRANNAVSSYALHVKNYVYNDPGYLNQIKEALQDARASATSSSATSSIVGIGPLGSVYNYAGNLIGLPGQGTHSFTDPPNNWQTDNAVDIRAAFGTPVYAVQDGKVGLWGVLPDSGRAVWFTQDAMSRLDRFGGNRINIDGSSQSTYYAHLSRINVEKIRDNATIRKGDLIGWTGIANGAAHLHFACESGDPRQFLSGVNF